MGLSQDFNDTAERFLKQEVGNQLLLAKYGLMLKFQAQAAEEKADLVGIMCDTALKALDMRAAPGWRHYLGASDAESIAQLLKTLESADSAALLPATAPARLAETGMKFVRRAETTTDLTDRTKFTDYARLCLDHAEKMQSIIDLRKEDVSLAKNITPAKRIVLKKDAP